MASDKELATGIREALAGVAKLMQEADRRGLEVDFQIGKCPAASINEFCVLRCEIVRREKF